MSVTLLRPLLRSDAALFRGQSWHGRPDRGRINDAAEDDLESFGVCLLRSGKISAEQLMSALAAQSRYQGRFGDALIATGALDEQAFYTVLAQHWAVGLAKFDKTPPDLALMARANPLSCLQGSWLPWRKLGQTTVIACAYPDDFAALRPAIEAVFGPTILAVAPRKQIEQALMARAGAQLARRAETLVPCVDSCRTYQTAPLIRATLAMACALAIGAILAPAALFIVATGFTLSIMYAQTLLKIMAVLHRKPALRPVAIKPAAQLHLVPEAVPTISIMVALYKESRIVARLIRRLGQLDYPRDKLDVIFVTEDNDQATAAALAGLELPPWLRVLPVPTGTIRTKPRALNYGLDHCRGSIIGVYDAEDAPAHDQLRLVADRFRTGDDRLACLQGQLDFYNPHSNWLSRCFTIEYAAWWRVFLPGIERLGLALPLGGTTLFFRRAALQDLGGWDAHNVTEDADLGIRIARRGYRTELIATITMEEANCRALPWIKQRSRWIKGFMMTWATHMRAPGKLLAELGLRRFIGFQVMFAGSFLQALLAPMLWLFWLVPFGLFNPAQFQVQTGMLYVLSITGLVTEAFLMGCNYAAILKTRHAINPLWLPSMILYNMLASFSAYKALWEMLTKPFYWDKTTHGFFDT